MSNNETLIKYEDVLKKISKTENHLLLGNGFNNSLKVGTSYNDIFVEMKKEYSGYEELEEKFKENNEDIEALIGVLTQSIPGDNKEFLSAYINNKVKLDFMKAANTIVQSKIKNIYNNKNERIYILFSNFTNYFTLNYDPFLYLLLMKFKKLDNNTTQENHSQINTLGFTETLHSQYTSLTKDQQELYKIIKGARENGTLTIDVDEESSEVPLKETKKTQFTNAIETFLKKNNHPQNDKDIKKVVDHLWIEEQNNKEQRQLELDDGFRKSEKKGVLYKYSESQNIFFIHGAFHIKESKNKIHKITQTSEQALYTRIEEAINNEEEIICVFRHNDKLNEINNNEYLRKAYEKLATLKGSLVIIGCSLSENDRHVFKQIEKSNIDTVYISSMATEAINIYKKAKCFEKFEKNVVLFDAESISYEKPKAP